MTVAELKRNAKSGKLSMELLQEGMWADGLPNRLKGIRPCVGVNSTHLILKAADSEKRSQCDIPRASLVEYTGTTLKIYYPGLRAPTALEKAALDEWDKITETPDFKERVHRDMLTDGWSTHRQKEKFFQDKGMYYLTGFQEEKGLLLVLDKKARGEAAYIRDKSIKGDLQLSYKIYTN